MMINFCLVYDCKYTQGLTKVVYMPTKLKSSPISVSLVESVGHFFPRPHCSRQPQLHTAVPCYEDRL